MIDLVKLDQQLTKVGPITQVDIYGGEAGTLPAHYGDELVNIVKWHTKNINVISNFSVIPDWFHRPDITVSASYDWTFRQHHEKVLNNIIGFSKQVPVLMLATEELCSVDPREIAQILNSIRNIKSLEVKPYSVNQFNQFGMNWNIFEEWIKQWLALDLKFELVNRTLLENSVNKLYNAYSDNHLYIGPDGEFSVLDFDLNDREYFKHIRDIDEYRAWVAKERNMVEGNKFCSSCEWQGHCMTEHYRDVKSLDHSCNGFKHLLDWYARLED